MKTQSDAFLYSYREYMQQVTDSHTSYLTVTGDCCACNTTALTRDRGRQLCESVRPGLRMSSYKSPMFGSGTPRP